MCYHLVVYHILLLLRPSCEFVAPRSYAFCLGVTPYVTLRFFHHAAVEYFVIETWMLEGAHQLGVLNMSGEKGPIVDSDCDILRLYAISCNFRNDL